MTTPLQPRPWYCSDALVADYRVALASGGDLEMLKLFKIVRSIVVNVGLFYLTFKAIEAGVASPWVIGISVVTIGLYNGVEIADYQALARAVIELQAAETHSDDE